MSLPEGPDEQTIIKHIKLLALAKAWPDERMSQIELDEFICQLRPFSKVGSRLPGKVGFSIPKMGRHKIKHTTHSPWYLFLRHDHIRFLVILQNQARLIRS